MLMEISGEEAMGLHRFQNHIRAYRPSRVAGVREQLRDYNPREFGIAAAFPSEPDLGEENARIEGIKVNIKVEPKKA
jgi:hypothetical protein